MDLNDLLNASPSTLTDEELRKQISLMKKLKVRSVREPKTVDDGEGGIVQRIPAKRAKKVISNEERRLQDLLSKLSPEQLAALKANLESQTT